MTQDEHILLAGQIKCLLQEIDNYQASIINLEASPAVILLANGIKKSAIELGELQYRYHNEEVTND